MGLFEKLFPRKVSEAAVYTYFRTLGGYTPVYTSFDGGVYEMALTPGLHPHLCHPCEQAAASGIRAGGALGWIGR